MLEQVCCLSSFVERKTLSKKIGAGSSRKWSNIAEPGVQKQYGLSDEIMDIARAIRDGVGQQMNGKTHLYPSSLY